MMMVYLDHVAKGTRRPDREHRVPCQRCHTPTWEHSAVCNSCFLRDAEKTYDTLTWLVRDLGEGLTSLDLAALDIVRSLFRDQGWVR